jgi:hypothetical protein
VSLLKKIIPAVLLLSIHLFGHATSIEKLQNSSVADQQKSKHAQLKINQLDAQKRELIEQVSSVQAEVESLVIYNQYLNRLLVDQDSEKTSLETQISSVSETRQGIVPLMITMLENLATFIKLDSPFLITERQQRLAQLQKMMNKSDVSDAEKYRRILTTYHIEAEYGSKMGQYQAELIIDGIERTVNFFYLGRIVFVAVTLDSKSVWMWDRDKKEWVSIDTSYASDINKAIRIAQKTDIPALLKLPLLSKENK